MRGPQDDRSESLLAVFVNGTALRDCGVSAPTVPWLCMAALQGAPSLPGPATPSVARPRPGMCPTLSAIAHEACWRSSDDLSQTFKSMRELMRPLASTRVTPTHLEQNHVTRDLVTRNLGDPRIAGDRIGGPAHCQS